MTSRIGAWLLGLLSLVCSVGYFIWLSQGTSPSATEAQLYPAPVLGHILSQLDEAAPPLDWNIPWLSILVWAAWLFSTVSVGYFVRNGLKSAASDESAALGLAISFGVGFAVIGLIQLLLGVIGIARIPLIPILAMGSAVSLLVPVQRITIKRPFTAGLWQWKQMSAARKTFAILAIAAFSLLMIPAFTPPVQSDGVRYHIGAVQEYLKSGTIHYLPSNAYSNMPFLVEMHFMAALACRAPEATQLIHLTLALFTSLAIYALASHLPGNSGASRPRLIPILAGILYLGTPMSAVLATWPFTDHGISFFLIACAINLSRHPDSFSPRSAIETGLLLGGLIGTKYTMAPVAIALLAVPLLASKYNPGRTASPKKLYLFIVTTAIVAGVTGGVWFLKNLLYTGNPFYPLATHYFPGGEWTAEANRFLHSRADAKGMGKGLLQFFTAPWNATFHWMRFESHNPGPTPLLAVLSFLAAILCLRRSSQRGTIAALVFTAVLSYAIWFFSYQGNRLLLPTLALMLALVPANVLHVQQGLRHQGKLAIAFGLSAGYGLAWALQWSLVTTALTPPPLPYLLGNQDRNVYRYQSLTCARAYDYLNQRVEPGEKVLLVGEHRIFGAEFEAVWSDWFDTPILAHILRTNKITTLESLLHYLKSHNIRWILINEAELAPQIEGSFRPRFKPGEWQIFEELRRIAAPEIKRVTLPPSVIILQLNGGS